MREKITSVANLRIKELVRLRNSSKHRAKLGYFVVEGITEIKALIEAGKELEGIFFSMESLSDQKLNNLVLGLDPAIPQFELSTEAMRKISYTKSSHSIVGMTKTWKLDLPPVDRKIPPVTLVLDEVEKPGNLGAMLRTAEAMGVEQVVLSDSCVDFFNPNVVRSSRGLFSVFPVAQGTKIEVWEWLKKSHFQVVGTSSNYGKNIHEFPFSLPLALIMGNEKMGLGSFWLEHIQNFVAIPMLGSASSLNLNAAAACSLMECNRLTGRV